MESVCANSICLWFGISKPSERYFIQPSSSHEISKAAWSLMKNRSFPKIKMLPLARVVKHRFYVHKLTLIIWKC